MENLRVRLTKKMIQDALLDLLKNTPLNRISIVDLCNAATVNRTTFYKYYGSQYDVLNEIVNKLFKELEERGNDKNENHNGWIFSKDILNYFAENKRTFLILLDKVPFDLFSQRLLTHPVYDNEFLSEIRDDYSEEQKKTFLAGYKYGCFGIISGWLHSENPLSIDQLYEITSEYSKLYFELKYPSNIQRTLPNK